MNITFRQHLVASQLYKDCNEEHGVVQGNTAQSLPLALHMVIWIMIEGLQKWQTRSFQNDRLGSHDERLCRGLTKRNCATGSPNPWLAKNPKTARCLQHHFRVCRHWRIGRQEETGFECANLTGINPPESASMDWTEDMQ